MTTSLPSAAGFDFWRRQVDRLGDRDPLEVLAETAHQLEHRVVTHDLRDFARQPFPGKWTPADVLGHLVDVEWIFGFRVRTMFADRNPAFGGVDQDRWVAEQRWTARPADVIVRAFTLLREVNLGFWRGLDAAALERTGRHSDAGVALSLGQMRSILAGHDLIHLDQLDRYLEAARSSSKS